MVSKIRSIISTATFKQSGITIVGTFTSAIIGWLFYIIAARSLGPEDYGIFSVATTTAVLAISILNVGTDTGVVRFVAKYIHSDKRRALQYLKLGFMTKVAAGLLSVMIGLLGGRLISTLIGKPELNTPISIALAGAGVTLLFNFTASAVQALQKFFLWSTIYILNNLLRLLVFIVLTVFGLATVTNTLWLYLLAPLLGFLIGMVALPRFLHAKSDMKLAKTFYNYNVWIAAFSIISAIGARLDTFLSARFLTLSEVGVYSVAVGLSGLVVQFVLALGTVIAPKLSKFTSDNEAISYLKKIQLFVSTLGVLGIVIGIPIAYFIIPLVYGTEFSASFIPFSILLIGQAFFLISVPIHNTILYYFSQPKFFVFTTVVHLILIAVLGSMLIHAYGMLGAAITVTIGMIFNFIVPATWVVIQFKKRNENLG